MFANFDVYVCGLLAASSSAVHIMNVLYRLGISYSVCGLSSWCVCVEAYIYIYIYIYIVASNYRIVLSTAT